ncbi:hypothetical protein TrST_g6013 [Triparma strigata]|uniref:Uncharacterized protein n=1 Tax=Triparma strigata TaxID=1606541 RepID=A0A9W7EA34_9STRA|nr:hypothetical protein TrST_g6013 [Triparma strigata]
MPRAPVERGPTEKAPSTSHIERFCAPNKTAFLIRIRNRERLIEQNSRPSLPSNHPVIREIVKNRLKARTKMGGLKANQTSTWPCDPITAQKQRHLHKALLLPEGEVGLTGGITMTSTGKGKTASIKWGTGLLPAGYDEDPGAGKFAKVPVAPAPAVPLVKDREMYVTSQQRSFGSVYAPLSKPYDHNNKDKSKMSSLDLVLERRLNLKDEIKALESAISRRIHEMPPVTMNVPSGGGSTLRPSTSLGFTRKTFELKDQSFGSSGGYSRQSMKLVDRPISVRSHRKITGTNVNPGSSFKWSYGFKTTNEIMYAK